MTKNKTFAINLKKVVLKPYQTPENLMRQFLSANGEDPGNLEDWEAGEGMTSSGKKTAPIPVVDIIKGIKKRGLWGFIDINKGVIHLWHNGKQKTEDFLDFFGHELGHIALPIKARSAHLAEEMRCEQMAAVTRHAYMLAQSMVRR